MRRSILPLAALTALTALATPSPAGDVTARPALSVAQGRYFRYALADGWQVTETTNGLEMAAPDRVTGVGFILLIGGFGQATPESFLYMILNRSPIYQNLDVERVRPLPSQPGVMGMPWSIAEADMTYVYRGVPCRAHATVGVIQGAGQYVAFVRSYQAPQTTFSKARYWLPALSETIVITDPGGVGGNFRAALPKGTSHDYIYGDYNRAWRERGVPDDRIARNQHEGTMGYERMIDPQTGQLYDMPLETYDASRGGYVNPRRPTELLTRAPLGH